ncbi:MAG: peptidyl-prolyl cis-trans isomerase, partial [Vicingaceae bacterium]
VDQIEWEVGVSNIIEDDGRHFFVHVKEVIEPSYKTLDDARGTITSDYQSQLEKEWIQSLHKKYEFTVDSAVLNELKSELE